MAATMSPSPSGGAAFAELDLTNPRIRAAMKVLGVLPREVSPLNPANFEGNEQKFKHFEQKRRNLIEEVRRKSEDGSKFGEGGEDLISSSRAAANAAFMEAVERAEAANMAMMQKIAKKEVQKVVIQELETKATAARNKKRQAESEVRVKELLKARDEELAARKKEAEKKLEKSVATRTRANQALEEKAKEMATTIEKKGERALNQIMVRKISEAEQRVQNREKNADIWIRQLEHEDKIFRRREETFDALNERLANNETLREERMSERLSHADEIAAKHKATQEYVRKFWDDKQANAEKKYREICDRHQAAAHHRDDELKSRVKEYSMRNTKRTTTHASRYERMLDEWEKEQTKKQDERMSPKGDNGGQAAALLKSYSEQVLVSKERRKNHAEVVAENRERLRRAHHHAVEQQVDKLRGMRDKVQVMERAKSDADMRRTQVMAKCAREKMHLQHRVDRTKDSADPEKMYRMLEELDPDPEAVGRINELLGELGMQSIGFTKEGDEEAK